MSPRYARSSLLTDNRNLLTEMPWELDGFRTPPGFERIGPIFAHIDGPLPLIVEKLAAAPAPLVISGSDRLPTAS